MTRGRLRGQAFKLATCLLFWVIILLPPGGPWSASPQVPPEAGSPFQYTGPGSCSSTSCHGSVQPREETRVRQNEYSIWIVQDKHAKAFTVLTNPISERMARLLGLSRAQEAAECLACHTLNVPPPQRARTFDLSDGVSCESCHGPAASWLGSHTQRDWTHEKSLELGMYDTKDVVRRAEKCLSCHLGTAENSVNHAMIAAGHPALLFELDTFSAVMPRHWQPPEDDPWHSVRAWAVGQAVQLREAMRQLARRARSEVWPEYAEYRCYACHHSPGPAEQSWRQEQGYSGRRPGHPPWNAAHSAVFRHLLDEINMEGNERLDSQLERLAQLMSQLEPDRAAVAATAEETAALADRLTRQLETTSFDRRLTLRLLRRICEDAGNIAGEGEQAAEQAAMALDSLYLAYAKNVPTSNQAETLAAINNLFRHLENPSGYNAVEFARLLRRLRSLLP